MRTDIRFAGMTLGWAREYVSAYARKLKEMGFCIRPCENGNSHLIAYSHREFSTAEMKECLFDLLSGEGKADKSSEVHNGDALSPEVQQEDEYGNRSLQ